MGLGFSKYTRARRFLFGGFSRLLPRHCGLPLRRWYLHIQYQQPPGIKHSRARHCAGPFSG